VLHIVSSAFGRWRSCRRGAAFLLAGNAAGCLPPAPQAPTLADELRVTGGIAGAVVDISSIRWQPGLATYDLPVAGQGTRSLVAWVPEAAEPRAVLVLLHGTVRQQKDASADARLGPSRLLVSCLGAPALGFLDALILAPSSSTGQWWARSDTEFVLGLVLAARSRWPAAGARSVILGYSNGGIGAWYFARLYPEYFRAAIPMAFNETIVGASRLPIYAIQGSKDEEFEFAPVRAAIQALQDRGQDVTLDAKYRGSHHAMCSYVPELGRAGRWLVDHVLSHSAGAEAAP
jgi:predicted esterase